MNIQHNTHYHSMRHHFDSYRSALNEFEEAYYDAKLLYSLRHFAFIADASQDNITEALQRALKVCTMAGEDSRHHFKQIYVFNPSSETMHIDWLMSKNGFSLMVMQITTINEKGARWLWKLANGYE